MWRIVMILMYIIVFFILIYVFESTTCTEIVVDTSISVTIDESTCTLRWTEHIPEAGVCVAVMMVDSTS